MEPTEFSNNWENFIKMLLHRLDIPTKEDIANIHKRLDKLEQLIYQNHPSSRQKNKSRTPTKKSASSIVLSIIGNHPEGTNFKTIKAATGFDDKKLRNIIFRLDRIEKIQRVSREFIKKFNFLKFFYIEPGITSIRNLSKNMRNKAHAQKMVKGNLLQENI